MKLKKIILISKNDDILYKVASHIYNIEIFPLKGMQIKVINRNKAEIYYKSFKVKMERS